MEGERERKKKEGEHEGERGGKRRGRKSERGKKEIGFDLAGSCTYIDLHVRPCVYVNVYMC